LTVVSLQKELKNRGLDTKGKKDELIARLQEAMSKETSTNGASPSTADTTTPSADSSATAPASTSSNDHDHAEENSSTTSNPDHVPTSTPSTTPAPTSTVSATTPVSTSASIPEATPNPVHAAASAEPAATTAQSEKKSAPLVDSMTDEEKKAHRANRFGTTYVPTPATPPKADKGKSKTGAKKDGVSAEDKEKLTLRAERFGLPKKGGDAAKGNTPKIKQQPLDTASEAAKRELRKARFASAAEQEEAEKKRKRAEKFSADASKKAKPDDAPVVSTS